MIDLAGLAAKGVVTLAGITAAGAAMTWFGKVHWIRLTQALLKQLDSARVPLKTTHYDTRELDSLPAPVQRYFHTVIKNGQPIITGVKVRHTGTFNVSARGEQWFPFSSEQRVVTQRPGFVWNARMRIMPGVEVLVHDAYVAGVGTLHPALLGLFSLTSQNGPDIARDELMRYLAESVWYPTALLPSQGVRWTALDDHSAQATLVDGDISLTMLFSFDGADLIEAVRAEARGALIGGKVITMPWECRLSNYKERAGMRVPLTGEVAWLLPGGRAPYYYGTIQAIAYEYGG